MFYNGPRAAINYNEDSFGGTVLEANVGFNMCRESGDHGIFNSWGRLPYLHDALGTGATTQKLWDQITRNLFIANYNSMAALDHDDASACGSAACALRRPRAHCVARVRLRASSLLSTLLHLPRLQRVLQRLRLLPIRPQVCLWRECFSVELLYYRDAAR